MDKITHEIRRDHWATLVLECNNSGMSKKAWMEAHHINEKQFYYWQRRLRKEAACELKGAALSAAVPSVAFAEIPFPSATETAPVVNEAPAVRADAVLRAGYMTLEVSNSLSPVILATLLQVMAHAQ